MKSLMTFAMLALISTAVAAAHPVKPQLAPASTEPAQVDPTLTDEEIDSRIHAFLGSIDTPIGSDRWAVLGPRAEGGLLAVVNGEELPTRRAKALDGLSFIGSTKAAAVFRTIAASESEPYVVRYAALRGLGRSATAKELVAQLKPLMASAKDVRIRAAAAEVLAVHAPKLACAAVRAQIKGETETDRLAFARAQDGCFAK